MTFYKHFNWKYAYESILEDESQSNKYPFLDVGTGDGHRIAIFKSDSTNIFGIDIDLNKLKYAKIQFKIDSIASTAISFPFKDDSFQTVTSFNMIEHLSQDDATLFLREVYRILKKNGTFYVETPNRNRITSVVNIILKVFKNSNRYPLNPDHIYEYTKEDLKSIFLKTRFNEIRMNSLFFGVVTEFFGYPINLGLQNPPSFLHPLCNQLIVYVKK